MPIRYIISTMMFLLAVLLYVDRACISVARGPMMQDLGLTDEQWAWVLSAFTLGYAIFQAPTGYLADRFGPRFLLTSVVIFWSIFTGITGFAQGFTLLFIARFLFGVGEAGALPGLARAVYAWFPVSERGLIKGINFSGMRLGAAACLPLMPFLFESVGWRQSFMILMGIGVAWAVIWWFIFRDLPEQFRAMSSTELEQIRGTANTTLQSHTPSNSSPAVPKSLTASMLTSRNFHLICFQYFCSNFLFYLTLTYLFPLLKADLGKTGLYSDTQIGFLSAMPLVGGAVGNWVSGYLIDSIYKTGNWPLSRRLPAIIGFGLAIAGTWMFLQTEAVLPKMAWFTLAILGADMTLSPSWSTCIDIGKTHAGLISGTMNMIGNLGAFLSPLSFHYLMQWTGSHQAFFFVTMGLNFLAILAWLAIDPRRPIQAHEVLPSEGTK